MRITDWDSVQEKLEKVYSTQGAIELVASLKGVTRTSQQAASEEPATGFEQLCEQDLALITYADSITSNDKKPLATLSDFITRYRLDEVLPIVHILPFYPWDTDRGFSVKDYYEVNPEYGHWEDCKRLSASVRLMYDFVANHASVDNPLVQKALIVEHLDQDDADYSGYLPYKDYVIIYGDEKRPSDEELKSLARPRAFPVLTKYRVVKQSNGSKSAMLGESRADEHIIGSGLVWTTFARAKREDGSEDTRQVDLNFKNSAVFLETIKILFFYLQNNAELIRLDAIGYLWKRLGSSSLHEPECHVLIEVINDVLKLTAPQVITIAEVNEPQEKAFLYLGSKENPEADMAYQFSHFSLAIHAVLTGKAQYYSNWLESIYPYEGRQFTTALGSHDGLAMKQARELLPEVEFEALCRILIEEHGGLPNMGILPGGKKIVYEVCATPWNLINNPNQEEDFALQLKRYIAVAALGLCVPGIPAIYFQGLFGAKNYFAKGRLDENRSVNREVFKAEALYPTLDNPESHEAQVFHAIKLICSIRRNEPAFNPHTGFEVINNHTESCVTMLLRAKDPKENVLSLVNVSANRVSTNLGIEGKYIDVLNNKKATTTIEPYQVCWLKSVLI